MRFVSFCLLALSQFVLCFDRSIDSLLLCRLMFFSLSNVCLTAFLMVDTVRTEDGEILAKFNRALASIVTTDG